MKIATPLRANEFYIPLESAIFWLSSGIVVKFYTVCVNIYATTAQECLPYIHIYKSRHPWWVTKVSVQFTS